MHQIDFIIVIKGVLWAGGRGYSIDYPKVTTFENSLVFGVGIAAENMIKQVISHQL